MSLGVVEAHVTYTKCPSLDITVIISIILVLFFIIIFFFDDQIFFLATILQLKVAKRRLFEKVSLERWDRVSRHLFVCFLFGKQK